LFIHRDSLEKIQTPTGKVYKVGKNKGKPITREVKSKQAKEATKWLNERRFKTTIDKDKFQDEYNKKRGEVEALFDKDPLLDKSRLVWSSKSKLGLAYNVEGLTKAEVDQLRKRTKETGKTVFGEKLEKALDELQQMHFKGKSKADHLRKTAANRTTQRDLEPAKPAAAGTASDMDVDSDADTEASDNEA
jgi:hypothetical protein